MENEGTQGVQAGGKGAIKLQKGECREWRHPRNGSQTASFIRAGNSINPEPVTRASEIARALQTFPQESDASGAFAQYLGVDGGSIWAAATSGPGAIAIHLLACMLAKLWSAPEATSIWEELVSTRKARLLDSDGAEIQDEFTGWAARCSLSRQQLANWDASARAWVRAADESNRLRQKQLKLIIENIDLPVNAKTNVYDSVIAAWPSAMTVLNKLVEGMPHSIENSAILLALSAWHLFPNMSVLSTENHFIKQDDPLIDPRGILTLGLQSTVSIRSQGKYEDIGRGITWSLPLAYYRFYGGPVEKEKNLNTHGSRISMHQLVLVALGGAFSEWKEKGFNASSAAALLLEIWSNIKDTTGDSTVDDKFYHTLSERCWLAVLARAAEAYLASDGDDRLQSTRLFNYGRRRCSQFLGVDHRAPPPFVSLRVPEILLNLIKTHEARMMLLRQAACRIGGNLRNMVIRYALPRAFTKRETLYAIATVVPTGGQESGSHGEHMRWLTTSNLDCSSDEISADAVGREYYEMIETTNFLGPLQDGKKWLWINAPPLFSKSHIIRTKIDAYFGDFAEMALFRGKIQRDRPRVVEGIPFEFLLGDPSVAAIYQIPSEEDVSSRDFGVEDVKQAMCARERLIPRSTLLTHLGDITFKSEGSLALTKFIRSLKTLATICQVYDRLGDVTVAMAVTSKELHAMRWMPATDLDLESIEKFVHPLAPPNSSYLAESRFKIQNIQLLQAFEPLEIDLASTFACIAMLESGNIDLSTNGMESVMAMSSGDSLFIANALISDPAKQFESTVRRIRGNVGRPGVAFLVPPEEPQIRTTESRDWNYLNFDEFDGVLTDSFTATSLHMSFTDFVLPIDTGSRGLRDVEIYFLETVISVHDKGQWMGDLDIIPHRNSPLLRMISQHSPCVHEEAKKRIVVPELTSIDSWREFLDRSEEPSVFRAKGNWMARLAATVISVKQGNLTLVFGDHICWHCGEEERWRLRHKSKPIFII